MVTGLAVVVWLAIVTLVFGATADKKLPASRPGTSFTAPRPAR